MKKILICFVSFICIALALSGVLINNYIKIPKEYRNKNVLFFNDDIKWSSTKNQVKRILGDCSIYNNPLSNGKNYCFESNYKSYKTKIIFESPNRFTSYFSNVTCIIYVPEKMGEECFTEICDILRNSCVRDNLDIIEKPNQLEFEAFKSYSLYGISYQLRLDSGEITLNIALDY